MNTRGFTNEDAAALEKLLDKTLGNLDEVYEALSDSNDDDEREEAIIAMASAIATLNNGLDKIAARRAHRYVLRAARARKRTA